MSGLAATIIKKDINFYYTLNKKSDYKFYCNLMKIITELGSTGFALFISSISYFFNGFVGFHVIVYLIISQFIIQTMKRMINRPRPYAILPYARPIKPPNCKYSLPSGHSSSAMLLALIFSSCLPALSPLLLFLAILVGISRISLGCHYPTDVIIGFAISIAVFFIATF